MGFIPFTVAMAILATIFFFNYPLVSFILTVLGFIPLILEFLIMLLSELLQIIDLFMPYFCVPICIALFGSILKIIKSIAQGNIEIGELETKEEEKRNDTEKKINIDKDLQKYFNYKEQKQ